MSTLRVLALNGLIRVAAAGSGQLFAFLVARRLAERAGAGAALVGFIGAAYFATELVGAPLAGRIADRRGQLKVLRWGPIFGIVSALVALLTSLTTEAALILATVLFLARLNEGASAACAVPTTLTLLARETDGDPARRTRVMGAFEVTSMVGMVAGYALVGFAWDALDLFAFLLLPPVYAAAWVLALGRESSPRREGVGEAGASGATGAPQPSVREVLGRLASEPGNVAFGVAWLAVNAVVGLWIQQAPFLLTLPERSVSQALVGGYSGSQVGLVFGAWGLAFLAGIALWAWLAPTWPRRRAMAVALVAMLGVVLVLVWVNHGGPVFVLWPALALVMVEAGFTPSAFAHLGEITEPLDLSRSTAMGLYSVLLASGQLAGNLLGGLFAARWQMDGVLVLTAILAMVALVGIGRMRPGR